MDYEFEGVVYERLRDMQAVRCARYVEHLRAGMNFAQAARAVGVNPRTAKAWRLGRRHAHRADEKPLVDWYAGRMATNHDDDGAMRAISAR